MRPARLAFPLAVVLVVALTACGSAETHTSATTRPARPKLALTPTASRPDAAIYPQRPTTYVLDGTLPDLGAVAPVRMLVARRRLRR